MHSSIISLALSFAGAVVAERTGMDHQALARDVHDIVRDITSLPTLGKRCTPEEQAAFEACATPCSAFGNTPGNSAGQGFCVLACSKIHGGC
ncbi:hypothetical protein NQ176_g2063 [Zarea fungicola]|uniref:Uncharacterized protein n=1 Tax=Zarea fungicola TaxID=93591 RepID=A0ACC1NR34_9HYPO|nr:hypothetical protein NQ176_g2063 [Lecanicillium fungicola]